MKVILQVVDPHLMNTSMSSKSTHIVVVSCRVLQQGNDGGVVFTTFSEFRILKDY